MFEVKTKIVLQGSGRAYPVSLQVYKVKGSQDKFIIDTCHSYDGLSSNLTNRLYNKVNFMLKNDEDFYKLVKKAHVDSQEENVQSETRTI